jgi:uncharacterized protein (TIGR02145 family)
MDFILKLNLRRYLLIVAYLMFAVSCTKEDSPQNSVTDKDGNEYKTIEIDGRVWMAENLKTTKYNDGSDIPMVTNDTEWSGLNTPAYCWYDNDKASYGDTYGALYNWYAVSTGKLCPTGWHVPTDAEWTGLTDFLGGEAIAGGKLKETGTSHWNSPNTGASDEVGFTALPGGFRDTRFSNLGVLGYWWTSTEGPMRRRLNFEYANVHRDNSNYFYGFSVRCIKN